MSLSCSCVIIRQTKINEFLRIHVLKANTYS
jgi:hypothetical protein